MKFNPTADRILIKPADPDKFRAGLEMFGADVVEKSEGTVIAVGTGVLLHNIKLNVTGEVTPEAMNKLHDIVTLIERGRELMYKPGDYVVYGKYAGTKVMIDEVEHLVIRECDVFGTLTE